MPIVRHRCSYGYGSSRVADIGSSNTKTAASKLRPCARRFASFLTWSQVQRKCSRHSTYYVIVVTASPPPPPPPHPSFLRRQEAIPPEGAPPPRAGTPRAGIHPLPRRGGSRTALTSAETHHPPLPHQAMSPKSDTNPLTRLVHMYYIHPRQARHSPQGQGGTTTQGEAQPRPPRTQRPSPSQRAAHTPPHGSSESRHLLIQRPRLTLPQPRRWKTP